MNKCSRCNELTDIINQLKAENDELKFQNKRLDEVATHWHKSIFKVERNEQKLKQTLTEIKEIAHKINDECELEGFGSCALKYKEQIFQKISEVEDEEN